MQNAGMQSIYIPRAMTVATRLESARLSGENRNKVIPEGYMDAGSNPAVRSRPFFI
jgi:hypothetical protein